MAISLVPWLGVRVDPPVWTDEGGTRRARLVYETPELAASSAAAAVSVGGYVYPDVSPHTPVGDWRAFWDAYPIAAAKATEGRTWQSSQWPTFLAEARRRGRLPVAYHFLWPSSSSPIDAQARNFLDYAWDGRPLGIMLDVETTGSGANPTMADASAWMTAVSELVGVPRARMLVYLPRWWWQAHGSGSTATSDSLLVNSDYRVTPNLAPFAGYDRVDALQFGSTIPIAGVGPGDMNRWLDGEAAMAAAMFAIGKEDDMPGPADWTDADWTAFWSRIPPSKDPSRRALNFAEALGYWPDGGLRGIRNDLDSLDTKVVDLTAKVEAGIKVSIDPQQLTPDQLVMIGEVFAGKVVITGVQAKAGQFVVTFEPA